MKSYAIMLAAAVSVSTLATNQVNAAPTCCSPVRASEKELVAATSAQENSRVTDPAISSSETASTAGTTSSQTQEIKLEVTTTYAPPTITVEKGRPVVLKVYRKDANNCGGELLIPDFGIKAEIPAGTTTEVNFTPTKAGSFPFTCGMQMMKGEIVVKESPSN